MEKRMGEKEKGSSDDPRNGIFSLSLMFVKLFALHQLLRLP
jgi:hypothetical protein